MPGCLDYLRSGIFHPESGEYTNGGYNMETIKREIQELKKHKVALIITIVCALFLLWLIISYIDVIMHNGIGMEHIYAKWNLFTLLF